MVVQSAAEAQVVHTLLRRHIRALYSNPPRWGAMVAELILNDEELKKAWEQEVEEMRLRVRAMREGLDREGKKQGVSLDFALKHNGICSCTGFTPPDMERLRTEFGVYGIDSGRIAMAGLTEPVLAHVAGAFAAVLKAR